MDEQILSADGIVTLRHNFLEPTVATILLQHCLHHVSWRHDTITLFGKHILQPRLTCLVGVPGAEYRYSGRTMIPDPMSDIMLQLMHATSAACGASFTSALLNLYRNGADYMGWHRDNERALGRNPTIASVSLGASRTFKLKHKHGAHPAVTVPLHHNSLLVMKGALQDNWYHSVPKETRVSEPRVNITFRQIL